MNIDKERHTQRILKESASVPTFTDKPFQLLGSASDQHSAGPQHQTHAYLAEFVLISLHLPETHHTQNYDHLHAK